MLVGQQVAILPPSVQPVLRCTLLYIKSYISNEQSRYSSPGQTLPGKKIAKKGRYAASARSMQNHTWVHTSCICLARCQMMSVSGSLADRRGPLPLKYMSSGRFKTCIKLECVMVLQACKHWPPSSLGRVRNAADNATWRKACLAHRSRVFIKPRSVPASALQPKCLCMAIQRRGLLRGVVIWAGNIP